MRVVAAMSGGVDSSVAAAKLVAAGHEVVGVHLALKPGPGGSAKGCGNPRDVNDARAVAQRLGIEFQVWDFAERFRENVVDYFVDEYAAGRTPNPCLRCNATMKFGAVLDRATELGFEAIGTGHYARIDPSVPALRRATHTAKDQSYVLAVLRPDQLRRCLFPVGDQPTKADLRAEAAALGLTEVAAKPDSTDICFIPDGDTAGFLQRAIGQRSGDIVDESGAKLGEHDGSYRFTVGQRRGLHLGRKADDGRPRYVLDISPVNNTVTVGPRERLAVQHLSAKATNWHRGAPSEAIRAEVQVRAHGAPLAATITPRGDLLDVVLDEPAYGVAAGQGLVVYDGDLVLAQATLTAADRAASLDAVREA